MKYPWAVWCCPARINERGDDYMMTFTSKEDCLKFIGSHEEAERVCFDQRKLKKAKN